MGRRHSFRFLHFRADDIGELFGGRQFAFEFAGKFRLQLIGGNADGVGFGAEGILDFHVVLFRAEDDADGWLVAVAAFPVVEQVQVEIHLSRELRFEGADFEVEGDEGLEEAVVEEEVDEILLFPEGDPVLAADEAEAVAEFEQEGLQARDEAGFEFAFPHGAAQAEKFQIVGTLEHLVGLLGEVLRQGEIEVVRLLFRDGALVGAGLDLVEQHIARPAEAGGGAEIPEAGGGGGEFVQNEEVLPPGNF